MLELKFMDPMSDDESIEVGQMYLAYLDEEFDRTGSFAVGYPIAPYLDTIVMIKDGDPAGFLSISPELCSVELIYVKPAYRGQGISMDVLRMLDERLPQPVALKGPLSPGGQALADKLNLRVTHPTPEQLGEYGQINAGLHSTIRKGCRHKRRGNPERICPRCYKASLPQYAAMLVYTQTMAVRAVHVPE